MNRLIILLFAVMVMAFAVPASALINGWEAAAEADSPGFIATNVPLGVYDIGAYGVEQTYEFVVNCNPDETAASMALIGRHGHGDTTAAIKYEQWNNTETYGATIFGVADHDFGVPINRGVDTHLAFVSSAGETALYVDGVYQASVATEIALSGLVGIGGANRDPEGAGWVDPFDGDMFGVAIYDAALSVEQIAAHSDAYHTPLISVVRSGGVTGDRDPIGPYDTNTAPLATEAGDLQNGNLVFSDRTYPWSGIPRELDGSKYIRTFNSDKSSGDVTYELTLSEPATVWVTVDDRFSLQETADSVTAAIAEAFVDTFIDIYIHENATTDRALSVFAAELPAGTYVFGGQANSNNFYILGATMESIIPGFYPGDIAISTQAGWYSQGAADREMQEVVDNVSGTSVEVFTADDQVCLLGWVYTHTGNGVADLLILNGQFPDLLYAGGNAEPDGSLAEAFLDDGNFIINTGDYMFYVNNAGNNNAAGGLQNMMDIFNGAIDMWDDNTSVAMTAEGHAVAPSLQDLQTDRPFHLDALEGDWETELILAGNAAGTRADPVIVVNTVTGGRLGIFYQTASQDDDPRGEVMSEWINNWYLTGGRIPNSTDWIPAPEDGAISVGIDDDLSWTAGIGAASHDVYFGTELPIELLGITESTSFDPGTLEYGTTYYWQVDAVDKNGNVLPGTLQSFTTTTPVGIFEYTQDIGGPAGLGRTTYEGYVWKNDTLAEQYRVMGGGADIVGTSDQFHFAWNRVSGDVLISASFEWVVASNEWAKMGVMLRAGTAGNDISHSMVTRRDENLITPQHRYVKGGDNAGITPGTDAPVRLGIQRITAEGLTWIQSLADFGDGWESMEVVLADDLPDELLVGICVTSHDNSHLVQARATDITFELNPSLVGDLGLVTVPASADLGAPTSDISGFSIRSLKPLVSDGWGYNAMNELLDTGTWMGLPAMPGSEGTRIDEFVNLRDTSNGAFSEANGYPDASFPGIDPLEVPAQDPAAGDDDDNFATEILGCIQLTAGLHYIGANSDDGTIIEIGGVEVARTGEWKGASNVDFLYKVEADGYYNLRARWLEGGGGANLELHEIFMDGTRILLNDVANGGSAVFAPAP